MAWLMIRGREAAGLRGITEYIFRKVNLPCQWKILPLHLYACAESRIIPSEVLATRI